MTMTDSRVADYPPVLLSDQRQPPQPTARQLDEWLDSAAYRAHVRRLTAHGEIRTELDLLVLLTGATGAC